ncbi:hypothetical protein [Archangium sp.]
MKGPTVLPGRLSRKSVCAVTCPFSRGPRNTPSWLRRWRASGMTGVEAA